MGRLPCRTFELPQEGSDRAVYRDQCRRRFHTVRISDDNCGYRSRDRLDPGDDRSFLFNVSVDLSVRRHYREGSGLWRGRRISACGICRVT